MRDYLERLLSTWPGRIAAIFAIALVLSLLAFCARGGGEDEEVPAGSREAQAPASAPVPDAALPDGTASPSEPAPDTAYSPDNPDLSTEIMGWLVEHGFPYTASVIAVSDEVVDVGNGATARLVIWSVEDGEAYIAGQQQDGRWTVWTPDGPDGSEAPSMRSYDGMLSIYQADALAELMPSELAESLVDPWLSFAGSRRVSGTSARIPTSSVSADGDAASFLLVVDDFDGSIPETRFFLAACSRSKKGWKCSFEEIGADEARESIGKEGI